MKTLAFTFAIFAIVTTSCALAAPIDEIRTLPSVQGEIGRPQIWQYRRGDKKVWILGSITTIPRHTAFDDSEISRRIASADAILGAPDQAIGENIGVLRALTLWRSIHREKFNENGARLSDVLAPETYAHWRSLKSKLLGASDDFERLRPMYAAYELFKAATKQMEFADTSPANTVMRDTARRLGRDVVDARFHLPVSDARATVSAFDVSRNDDIACLDRTMVAIDKLLPNADRLRDAWATGDVRMLEEFAPPGTTVDYCWAALTNQAIARSEGIANLSSAMNESWLHGLRSALAKGDSVFSVLPVADLTAGRGAAALLLQDGFVLEEPAAAPRRDLP